MRFIFSLDFDKGIDSVYSSCGGVYMFLDEKLLSKLKPVVDIDMAQAIEYIKVESLACAYSGVDINSFMYTLVIRGDGKVSYFKLLDGVIIEDEADIAYSNSRELIGVSDKNIDIVLKVRPTCVGKDGFISWKVTVISTSELRRMLSNTRKPKYVKYVVGLMDGFYPTQMFSDKTLMEDSMYSRVLSCLKMSYKDSVNYEGDMDKLDYHIVKVG